MAELFANNAYSTLGANIDYTATSLSVASAASFPPTGNFRLVVDGEIMLVTAVSGNVFSVDRGLEGTVARGHEQGTPVKHILTAGALDQLKADILAMLAPPPT